MPKAGLSSIESEGLSKQEENIEAANAVWQHGTVAVFAMWLYNKGSKQSCFLWMNSLKQAVRLAADEAIH